eukprot:GEMP01020053.1.p1 GENE.GEMP01020053.1~~GEMP01020053.1.p1  ORF type:complete len:486 (+),score=92.40 GEMP01020053.1:104-1561(+)
MGQCIALHPIDDWYSALSDSEVGSESEIELPDPNDRMYELKRTNGLLKNAVGLLLLVTIGVCTFAYDPGRSVSLMVGIPIVASLFTWFHIWLAIQMMFHPIIFFGYEISNGIGIGWQGVVPRKAEKMAHIAYEKAKPYAMDLPEIFGRVDAVRVITGLSPRLDAAVARIVRKVGGTEFPKVFAQLPKRVEVELASKTMDLIRDGAPDFFAEVIEVLCTGMVIEDLIITAFVGNRSLLNSFFQRIGQEEFHFVERVGAVMGLLLGFLQLFIYSYLLSWQKWIFLPLTGFLLGGATNWFAIQACFRPVNPYTIRLCKLRCLPSIRIQGLFLQRQEEVCRMYSSLLCRYFMNLPHLIQYLQTVDDGRLWDEVNKVYNKHVEIGVTNVFGKYLAALLPASSRESVKDRFAANFQAEFFYNQRLQKDFLLLFNQMTDVERTNAQRMSQMRPEEFEQLLHPIFKEDEWILILLGSVLGAVVGLGQVVFLGG